MGSCCSKKIPNVEIQTEADGNVCCDDLEYSCPSTCCVIITSEKAKVRRLNKHHVAKIQDKKINSEISV